MKIYHNNRCSKSRNTLKLIEESNQDFEVINYLDNPPTKEELTKILHMLNIPAEKLVRKGEAIFKEHFKGKTFSEQEWIDNMIEYPKLIERPIVVHNGKAVIGRPPENVNLLFS
ncbi:MAG: arsenate reductase (glutaredoxin) [Flavobacteriales bacterium]